MKHIKSLMEKVGKGEGGFTLIELLIVIVILVILAAVVVLNVGGFMGRGFKEAAKTEKDNVQVAIIGAMAANGWGKVTGASIGTAAGDTPASTITIASGAETASLGDYLTSTFHGVWTYDTSGAITAGTYTKGGQTGTFAIATGWTWT